MTKKTNSDTKSKPTVTVMGIADSGAMSNLWGLKNFLAAGFCENELSSVSMDIRAANKNPLNIIGAFKAIIEGKTQNGDCPKCICQIYVSDSLDDFYLSYDSMLDLGIIDKAFPTV